MLIGYWIVQGKFQGWNDRIILLGAVGTFACSCALAWWAYASPADVVYSYEFPGYLFCAAFLLEFLRRKAHRLERLRGVFAYLAEISLGIFFVHILVMEGLDWYMDFSGWHRSAKLLFLEGVSVGGSILIIWLLSHIKRLKQYLFLIKDDPSKHGPNPSAP